MTQFVHQYNKEEKEQLPEICRQDGNADHQPENRVYMDFLK